MIERYLLWRARRKQRAVIYEINLREGSSDFGSGFFAFLHQSHFYQPNRNRLSAGGRWGRVFFRFIALVSAGFFAWVIIESIRALQMF